MTLEGLACERASMLGKAGCGMYNFIITPVPLLVLELSAWVWSIQPHPSYAVDVREVSVCVADVQLCHRSTADALSKVSLGVEWTTCSVLQPLTLDNLA